MALVTPSQVPITVVKIVVKGGYMSTIFQGIFTLKKAALLIMNYWSICTPCTELNSPQPHHKIHEAIKHASSLPVHSMIY